MEGSREGLTAKVLSQVMAGSGGDSVGD